MRKLVFLTNADPTDVTKLSGTPHHMLKAVQLEFGDVEIIPDYKPAFVRKVEWLVLNWTRGRIDLGHLPFLNRLWAALIARRFGGTNKLFLAVLCAPIAGALAKREATINVSDATFAAIRPMYPEMGRLAGQIAAFADRAERACIQNARLNSYSSSWAAQSAIDDYGASPSRVVVANWGCNIDWVEQPSEPELPDVCRLLFIGVDWRRKGGELVLSTCDVLAREHFRFRVDLVGGAPDRFPRLPAEIKFHGRLDKSNDAERQSLQNLLRSAHFLFLPTRQDCTPMVFAEAMAFGVPAITRDVGGVSSVVENNVSGRVLPTNASPEDFAEAISAIWNDRDVYLAMRKEARIAYERRLNWRAWATKLRRDIEVCYLNEAIEV